MFHSACPHKLSHGAARENGRDTAVAARGGAARHVRGNTRHTSSPRDARSAEAASGDDRVSELDYNGMRAPSGVCCVRLLRCALPAASRFSVRPRAAAAPPRRAEPDE